MRQFFVLTFVIITALLVVGCEEDSEGETCNIEGCFMGNHPCYRPPESCGGVIGCDGVRCVCDEQTRCDDSSCEDWCWDRHQDTYGPRATGCWSSSLETCICYDPDAPYHPGDPIEDC